LIASFLVIGPHCNNVIGAKNKICNIECNYLHHIFDYHCDFGELFKRFSCWASSNFMWNFSAFVTLDVVAITNVSSNNLIMDKSKSTMIHVVCCNSHVTQMFNVITIISILI
jgi:hypothetical protein